MLDRKHTQPYGHFESDAPDWMSEEAIKTLMKGYLLKDETPNQMYRRISDAAASYYEPYGGLKGFTVSQLAGFFYEAFTKGWLSPATPVAANMGANDTGLPVSCNSISVGNSIDDIFKCIHEAANITKRGAGLGIDLSALTGISRVTDWAKFFDEVAKTISQSSTRRGAVALYLDINHRDILDFLNSKDLLEGDARAKLDCNIAVKVDRKFLAHLAIGSEYHIKVWQKVLELRMKFGSPYVQFVDNCTDADPIWYKDRGMKSGGSNLCLTGDTLVVTKQGIQPIKELVGKTVDIYDGNNWVTNDSFFYKGKAKVLRVHLKNGQHIDMTPDHRAVTYKGKRVSERKTTITLAKNLKIGQKLAEADDYTYSGARELSAAYLKGFLIGDGTSSKERAMLRLYSNKFMCEDKLLESANELKEPIYRTNSVKELSFSEAVVYKNPEYFGYSESKNMRGLAGYKEELNPYVTKQRYCLSKDHLDLTYESKMEFLSGLLDADGTVGSNNIQICSIHEDFIDSLMVFLQSMGFAPNKDSHKHNQHRKEVFRISLKAQDSDQIFEDGCLQRLERDIESKYLHYRRSTEWSKIVKIEELEGEHDVFCTEVKTTSTFALANGILTGNCQEIHLFHDDKHTYSCVLSSINLDKYEEYKGYLFGKRITLPELGIYFLDAVNEEYIQRGKGKAGMEKAIRGAEKGRALGLGVVGLHSLYQGKGLAWESVSAYALNREVFQWIRAHANKATQYLAEAVGECEWTKGYGVRNTHLLACAPTTTNSVLCGAGSPGIEPSIANYFSMSGAKGTFTRENKYLKALLKEKGYDTGTVWKSIREHKGSVQHLPFLSDREKAVFKTAYEIDQKHIVMQAAHRQRFIDQGQSLNLFFYSDADADYINEVHLLAAMHGVKGLYYLRSDSSLSKLMTDTDITYAHIKTRPDCIYCQKAKKLLDDYGIMYTEEYKETGRVPEIWIEGDKLNDGYNSLKTRLSVVDTTVSVPESDCVSCEG